MTNFVAKFDRRCEYPWRKYSVFPCNHSFPWSISMSLILGNHAWDNLAISTDGLLVYFLHKFGFFSVYFDSFCTTWLCQIVIWWLHSVMITSMCPVLQGWWSSFVFISYLVLSKPLLFSNWSGDPGPSGNLAEAEMKPGSGLWDRPAPGGD